ncbi:MAG: hypothetical protein ACE5D6_02015, partial [Candidatus Zixiibacteriota bacterium]
DETVSVTIRCTDSCGAYCESSFNVTFDINDAPLLDVPVDTSFMLCEPGAVTIPISATDVDNNIRDYTLVSGPGVMINSDWVYTPSGDEVFDIIVRSTDSCDAFDEKTVSVTIHINQLPVIADQTFSEVFCTSGELRVIDIIAADSENDVLSFELLSGSGSIDPVTGSISYNPDTAGTYIFEVAVSDSCGFSTAFITDVIGLNNAPQFSGYDSTIYLCDVGEISFPVSAFDPDGDSLFISQFDGPGQFTQLTENSGVTNFLPSDVDSATYLFAYCITDSCGAYPQKFIQPECENFISITVIINRAPQFIVCPGEQQFSTCDVGTFCFDISAIDPDDDSLIFTILAGNATITDTTVCVTGNAYEQFDVVIEVSDTCNHTDTCVVPVIIDGFASPDVISADDFPVNLCVIEPVCFDVIIGGPVTNIDSIWTNYGSYDENTQQVCFEPDTAGVYEIIISVVDSCGVLASDTTNVTVNLNDIPVVELGIDFDTTLCGIADICFDVNVSDNMLDYVSLNYGSYDEITGKLCFLADTSGTYRLILTATDICNISTADTVLATVTLSEPPFVDLGTDFDSLLCNISEVCIDVITIDNYASIITGPGSYYNEQTGQLCFTPDLSGNYTLSIEVIDSCGYSAIDEINISIQLNSSPVILPMPDTAVYLCYPELICLPTAITDLDNNIDSITVNRGSYQDSVVCFVPYDSGFYEIIVSAFDGCGEVTADTALVHVITDQAVSIICPNDTTIFVCDFDTLCFPIGGIPSNSVVTVTGINTWFDEQTQSVCFFAECATVNNITVNAATPCGTFSCQFTVTIECNTAPLVIFPPDTSIAICQVSEVCIPVGINDPDNNLDSVVVVGGTYDPISSQVCFATDSTGTYVIQLWAYDACLAEDFDEIIVDISLNSAPYINYTAIDSSFLSCANDSICVPIDIGDIDGNLTDVTTSIGSYHAQSGQICFYPDTSGSYSIIVTATDLCNIQTIDTADVSVALNTPPIVTVNDSSLVFCEIDTVCITFEAIDSDNNIVDIVSSLGTVVGSQICFLPPDFGVYEIIITAIDECGETDIDTASVTVSSISGAQFVTCPENVDTTLCGADTICIENVLITPAEAQVSIYDNGQLTDAAYDFNVGSICIYVNQPGTHNIRVIAEAPCGSDTCDFILQVAFNTEPVVSCPSQIDTVLCLVQTDSICFPVQITGIDVQVTVSPVGQYSNGFVCVPIVNAGTLNIEITATNICGSDTCNTTINVQDKQPPQLFLPDTLVYNRCPGDTNTICIDGIFATDADSIFSLNKVCGPGTYQPITNDSGEVCFLPDQFGYYEFCFETFNGCQTVVDTFYVEIAQATDCEVCVRVTIDGGSCASVGSVKNIDINVETNTSIGGFELFISYDASVMSFNGTDTVGTAVADWEYFTYRLESEDCGLACPSGIVKLFGLADITNGPNHPPDSSLNPNGTLAKIIFNISSDQNLGGQFLPINFGWYSCGDNTFSDPSGNQLYMDSRIFNAENILIWDEADDINFPDSIRPYGLGNEDSCLTNAVLIPPTRCVEFTYGGICIIPPSNQADRGDINLNGVAYEIGDAVLFSNYFIYGLSVFTIDLARQIASTDVNADGLTLSVADLVLLIRIIIGDADPFPKLIPYDDELA